MKSRWSFNPLKAIFGFLIVMVILAPSIWAFASDFSSSGTPFHQTIPTETPLLEQGAGVLTTNPALLQVIILLGIVAVLIIFIGVWISRSKVVSR